MSNRLMAILLVVGGLMAISVPLFAHHGNATYDVTKKPTVKGVVTEFIWSNPHCYLKLDAKGENGEVVHWIVEASNPLNQTSEGWTKKTFKPGDQVEIKLRAVAKDGQPVGRFGGKIVINGKVLPGSELAGDDPAN